LSRVKPDHPPWFCHGLQQAAGPYWKVAVPTAVSRGVDVASRWPAIVLQLSFIHTAPGIVSPHTGMANPRCDPLDGS